MKITYEDYRDEVRQYFVCCPFCGSEKLNYVAPGPAGHLRFFNGRDTLTCEECGAKWLLYFRIGFLEAYIEWAKLEIESRNGKGREMVGKEIGKEQWREMALETRRSQVASA
jgi:transcription elongation factor Elf1